MWNNTKDGSPSISGNYIVAINRTIHGSGTIVSDYCAHYDSSTGKWYKYDPFDDYYQPKEEITNVVVAWVVLPAYFG